MVSVRRIAVVVLICALPIAAGLVALPMVRASSPASSGGLELRNLELVRSYYAEVGEALHGGDTAAVERYLAVDFVEHQEVAGMPSGRAGVLAFLATVQASLVDPKVTIEDTFADGDRVTARITFTGRQRPELMGIPLQPATVSWETIDVWRVTGGALAEHWGDGATPSLLQPLIRARLDAYPVHPIVVALAAVTISPGASLPGQALPGPGLFLVESGELAFRGNGVARIVRPEPEGALDVSETPAPGTDVLVRAGEAVVLSGLPPALTNNGSVRTSGLLVALFPPAADTLLLRSRPSRNGGLLPSEDFALAMFPQAEAGSGATPDGVKVMPLTGGVMTEPVAGPLTIDLGRALLAPGGGIPPHTVAGFEAVAVASGTLDLQPGDPAALPAGAASTIRNATESPAVVLMLTIRTADGD